MINFRLLQDTTVQLLDLNAVKLHLKVDDTADDSLITALIFSAKQYCERYCNRSLINQKWSAVFDADDLIYFTNYFLPFGDIQEIEGVFLFSADNTPVPIDDTNYYFSGNRFLFNSNYNYNISSNYRTLQTMQIIWTAGFGSTADSVPQAIKQAVLLMIAHWYENRAAIYEAMGGKSDLEALPLGVKAILDSYRIYT